MALIDRVKVRTETDLDDTELQLLIDEANQDVISRYGPHSNPANPLVWRVEGNRENVVLPRPIDTTQTITVVEYITSWGWGETQITLGSNDYRIWSPGYRVQRISIGSNPPWQVAQWADQVVFTYVPINDGDQRSEVIVKLVILAIQYDAFSEQKVGDFSGKTTDYQEERNKLLATLAPRNVLGMS